MFDCQGHKYDLTQRAVGDIPKWYFVIAMVV